MARLQAYLCLPLLDDEQLHQLNTSLHLFSAKFNAYLLFLTKQHEAKHKNRALRTKTRTPVKNKCSPFSSGLKPISQLIQAQQQKKVPL